MSEKKSIWRHGMAKWGLFMGALFAIWFGGWFAVANFADGKITDALTQFNRGEQTAECTGQDVKGFPFRLGLNCEEIVVTNPAARTQIRTGALRTTSILYDPTELIAELDSPSFIQRGRLQIILNWSQMRLYTNVTVKGLLERLSLSFADFRANEGEQDLRAKQGAVHLRPEPEAPQNLDVAFNANALTVFSPLLMLPKLDVSADLSIKEGTARLLQDRMSLRAYLAAGANSEIRAFNMQIDDGGVLAISGPLSLSDEGQLSGELRIGVANPEALKKWAAQIDPNFANSLGLLTQAVAGMGQKTTIGANEIKAITVKIDRGEAKVGFITIAKIPRFVF